MAASDFISSSRQINVFSPVALTGGAIASTALDTKGWRWAVISVSVGAMAAGADGTIAVQFSATSGGTYATPTGATFVPTATSDNSILVGVVDLQQMNRWLQCNGTSPAGAGVLGITVTLYGCDDTTQYINSGVGEADVIEFTILT